MRRYRAIAAMAYLVVAPSMGCAAAQDPWSEGTWIVLILFVTLLIGAAVGRWSLVAAARQAEAVAQRRPGLRVCVDEQQSRCYLGFALAQARPLS